MLKITFDKQTNIFTLSGNNEDFTLYIGDTFDFETYAEVFLEILSDPEKNSNLPPKENTEWL